MHLGVLGQSDKNRSKIIMNHENLRSSSGFDPSCPQIPGAPLNYPAYVRLPKPPARCTVSGICRSTMIMLISGPSPSVRSKVLKRAGAKRGIRLVETASLLGYLASLPDADETINKEDGSHE